MSASGQHPPCSNCSERGLKCVYVNFPPLISADIADRRGRDEFAEVKAVKLLRRGRRLQQVECVLIARPTTPTTTSPQSRLRPELSRRERPP